MPRAASTPITPCSMLDAGCDAARYAAQHSRGLELKVTQVVWGLHHDVDMLRSTCVQVERSLTDSSVEFALHVSNCLGLPHARVGSHFRSTLFARAVLSQAVKSHRRHVKHKEATNRRFVDQQQHL